MSVANSSRSAYKIALYISAISATTSAYFIWQKRSTESHLELVCSEKAKLALEISNWRRWWNEGGRELVEREWRGGQIHGEEREEVATERGDMDELRREIDDMKKDLRRLNTWIEERKRDGAWNSE
jgi:hypothetical protein